MQGRYRHRGVAAGLVCLALVAALAPLSAYGWVAQSMMPNGVHVERQAGDTSTATATFYSRTTAPSSADYTNGSWQDNGWTSQSVVRIDPDVSVFEWAIYPSNAVLVKVSIATSGSTDVCLINPNTGSTMNVQIIGAGRSAGSPLYASIASTAPVTVVSTVTAQISNPASLSLNATDSAVGTLAVSAAETLPVTLSGRSSDALSFIAGLCAIAGGMYAFGGSRWIFNRG